MLCNLQEVAYQISPSLYWADLYQQLFLIKNPQTMKTLQTSLALAKKLSLLLLFLLASSMMFTSCDEEESNEDLMQDVNTQPQVVFWSDFQGPPIDVWLNDTRAGTITAIGSTPPECGSSGNATINVANGSSYDLYAQEQGNGREWRTTITIPQNADCYKFLLHL
jgi:hypothetical protein